MSDGRRKRDVGIYSSPLRVSELGGPGLTRLILEHPALLDSTVPSKSSGLRDAGMQEAGPGSGEFRDSSSTRNPCVSVPSQLPGTSENAKKIEGPALCPCGVSENTG